MSASRICRLKPGEVFSSIGVMPFRGADGFGASGLLDRAHLRERKGLLSLPEG